MTWEPSSDDGVAGYLVFRDGAQLARVDDDKAAYVDRTVAQLRTYAYDVRAVDGAGHRSRPASVSVTTPDAEPPSVPTKLRAAVDPSTKGAKLVWEASIDNVGVTDYRVLRDGKEIGTVPGKTTTFIDDDVDSAERYAYRHTVQALDAAGNRSRESAQASVPEPGPVD